MKVLWLCNLMMPMIAEQLNLEASNKEGWLSGLASVILEKSGDNGIELSVAFPAPELMLPEGHDVCMRTITVRGSRLACYGFREDVSRPELYDRGLEERLGRILDAAGPDLVHCFGTEYPHTLAMCRIFPRKQRLLVSIQGLCSRIAGSYFADLPEKAVRSATLRDRLRKDSILQQRQKFIMRGRMEEEAVRLAGNIAGRTEWDRTCIKEWNPQAGYYNLNETLRESFYGPIWKEEDCIPHSIFLSQGDYPIKGFHYMLKAMPEILEAFPDARLYVAGNSIIRSSTLKERLKLSGYGKYLRELIGKYGLQDRIVMLGRLDEGQMRERYLQSHLYVCCSAIENSPNSLGEAMLLGMPCVTADVGGIPSLFTDGEDGIMYRGFRSGLNNDSNMEAVSGRLAKSVIKIWKDRDQMEKFVKNARKHAEENHSRERNYAKMTEIYTNIATEPRKKN